MRYFTPQLVLRLNSSDSETVDEAMDQWENAIRAYRKQLEKVQVKLPLQSRRIAGLSLHDWNLVACSTIKTSVGLKGAIGVVLLANEQDLVTFLYSLRRKPSLIHAPEGWSLPTDSIHWLYDEVDFDEEDQEFFVHRILLSDGTTLVIPFSGCNIVESRADHVMSHSELVQIA